MVPTSSDQSYAHPTFRDHNPSSSGSFARTDPLPFASKFEPLAQSLLPEEPTLPGPPPAINTSKAKSHTRHHSTSNTSPRIDITMAATPPLVSPVLTGPSAQGLSSRASINSNRSTSPVNDRRPGRFQSDFAGPFKRASWQKSTSPDPSFRSHRRQFSEEAGYKTSAFTEQVVEEEEHEGVPDNSNNNNSLNTTNNTTRDTGASSSRPNQDDEIFHTVPTESPRNSLGLRYVSSNEGSGNKSQTPYKNTIPDDDYSSDTESVVLQKKKRPKADWLSIMILLLCIYSTIGSVFFFAVAVARPRYGKRIATTAGLKPQDAQLVSAIIAKTVELSFVSVFVSFIGQVLSRRALLTGSKGVNIAELSMRSWVTQPGTLLTHTSSVKFAGLTFLGALSLTATVFASFYTTAADTLVSPKLAWGSFEAKNLTGLASTSYANGTHRILSCETAIPDEEDPIAGGYLTSLARSTCDGVLSAGRGYRDLSDWNAAWAEARGKTYPDPLKRPAAPSSLDFVNYAGAWMQVTGENGVNRAIMAMPHPGIVAATKDSSLNEILQPDETGSGYGSFIVKASVPNPIIDVTCAPVDPDRVGWYIKRSNGTDYRRNGNPDPRIQQVFNFTNNATYFFDLNTQTFPDTYDFAAPRFDKAPIALNTVVTSAVGDPSVYFLVRSANAAPRAGGYTMCGMKSFVTPNCSSEFQAFESSGNISANCDLNNPLAFKEDLRRQGVATLENPIEGRDPVRDNVQNDFRDVAQGVLISLALGTGVSNSNASVARFLSQLALDTPTTNLSSSRPSLAEALAVLLGNAMITSAVDSVFTTYFPYGPDVPRPFTEYFNAQLATIEYTSGAGSGWKPIFYVVLIGVALMNVFCLIYFSCVRDGFVTDWTELQNLFCVVMDGGAIKNGGNGNGKGRADVDEETWKGTGGTGPMGSQYKVGFWFTQKQGRWYVTDGATDEKGGKTTGYEKMV
ncbi:uncharacterized protein DFL_000462 [Arthrobotrys flagrans]|uniref:Uncharacterized protein n=1 Tax=Arthrobotrys flagrans TaxID=97331 RepID=A0A437ADU5_ARTFL|nr:hypothetical protein DFL_000462 [Arthrobotrys flagrans]